mmetsp:Transcript_33405/g.79191  ORF Transcript_33405/g.79191 Transcript_33405/m.79191 type:complete len:530 (-) Transcript_33405:81-1670(-)
MLRRVLVLGASAPFAAAGLWASQQERPLQAAQVASEIPVRLFRDVFTASAIVYDYKFNVPSRVAEDYGDKLKACHQRGADRLLKLCFQNGGIYVKLGQHVGQLDHLLPEEYVVTMRKHLLDKCPVSPWEEVRATIKEDLGAYPEELFAEISREPMASASLAQVHVARDHDGRALAVKVQHAGLRGVARVDMATIEGLVGVVRRLFPDFNYQWLVDEVKENLPKELDFEHEAANAARCAANLASPRSAVGPQVVVPKYFLDRTSKRVLTMEFMEGVQVTDRDAMRRLGLRCGDVARLVAKTFAEMIFIHGDVHCDPHAANMLVRRGPGGRPELVLLDHGLYRVIDDHFRKEYAALWQALILADEEGIRRHSESMNAGDAYPLFASMLTTRPWEHITRRSIDYLAIPGTDEDKAAIQMYTKHHARDISDLLLRIPRALLLLLKTNDCLRSVDSCLGQPVNTYVITARWCGKALAGTTSGGLMGRAVSIYRALMLEWRVAMMQAMAWISRLSGAAPPASAVFAPAPMAEPQA